jgi:hypothetical protein
VKEIWKRRNKKGVEDRKRNAFLDLLLLFLDK